MNQHPESCLEQAALLLFAGPPVAKQQAESCFSQTPKDIAACLMQAGRWKAGITNVKMNRYFWIEMQLQSQTKITDLFESVVMTVTTERRKIKVLSREFWGSRRLLETVSEID